MIWCQSTNKTGSYAELSQLAASATQPLQCGWISGPDLERMVGATFDFAQGPIQLISGRPFGFAQGAPTELISGRLDSNQRPPAPKTKFHHLLKGVAGVACNSFEMTALQSPKWSLVDTCGIQVQRGTTKSSTVLESEHATLLELTAMNPCGSIAIRNEHRAGVREYSATFDATYRSGRPAGANCAIGQTYNKTGQHITRTISQNQTRRGAESADL